MPLVWNGSATKSNQTKQRNTFSDLSLRNKKNCPSHSMFPISWIETRQNKIQTFVTIRAIYYKPVTKPFCFGRDFIDL